MTPPTVFGIQKSFGFGEQPVASSSGTPYEYPEYKVTNSVRYKRGDNPCLHRTQASGSANKFTVSMWWKSCAGPDYTQDNQTFFCNEGSEQPLRVRLTGGGKVDWANNTNQWRETAGLFLDKNSWYHMVWQVDTGEGNEEDRLKLWVNGCRYGGNTSPQTGSDWWDEYDVIGSSESFYFFNTNQTFYLGSYICAGNSLDGWLAEVHVLDGYAYDASYFGELLNGNEWHPIDYKTETGNYGSAGFYLDFSNATSFGNDASGNGNNLTMGGFNTTTGVEDDHSVESPSLTDQTTSTAGGDISGMYPVLNGYFRPTTSNAGVGNAVIDQNDYGSLRATSATTGKWQNALSNIPIPPTGKWYAECTVSSTSPMYTHVGCANIPPVATLNGTIRDSTGSVRFDLGYNGTVYVDGGSTSGGSTWSGSTVIGVCLNCDDGEGTFLVDGSAWGGGDVAFSADFKTELAKYNVYFMTDRYKKSGQASGYQTWNFGSYAFTHAAPSGYSPICTALFPAGSAVLSGDYIGTGSEPDAGPYVQCNCVPKVLKVGGTAVVWGTDMIKTGAGFKVIGSTYNGSGTTYSWEITDYDAPYGAVFRGARGNVSLPDYDPFNGDSFVT